MYYPGPNIRWQSGRRTAFTLIELLTVVAIISLLISMLMPSLSRARDQAKGVHCLARLKDIGNGLATYENMFSDVMPPADWQPDATEHPDLHYGWTEMLYRLIYRERVYDPADPVQASFPVQRNVGDGKWAVYFDCKAASRHGVHSGHYRVYLPTWAYGTYGLNADGTFDDTGGPDPTASLSRSSLSPRLVLMGDANEWSERGDGDTGPGPNDDCSFIDAGEADISGPDGRTGNRFSDRHYGGTNYLFQDLHGEWSLSLRDKLARDYDMNGIVDISSAP